MSSLFKEGDNPSLITLDVIAGSYHLKPVYIKIIPCINLYAPYLRITNFCTAAPPDHSTHHHQHSTNCAPLQLAFDITTAVTGFHMLHSTDTWRSFWYFVASITRSKIALDFTNNNQYLCPVVPFFPLHISISTFKLSTCSFLLITIIREDLMPVVIAPPLLLLAFNLYLRNLLSAREVVGFTYSFRKEQKLGQWG